jgi:hypothetical protein
MAKVAVCSEIDKYYINTIYVGIMLDFCLMLHVVVPTVIAQAERFITLVLENGILFIHNLKKKITLLTR